MEKGNSKVKMKPELSIRSYLRQQQALFGSDIYISRPNNQVGRKDKAENSENLDIYNT